MKTALRVCAVAGSMALAMTSVACSNVGEPREDAGEVSSALGFAQAPPPPDKRIVRLRDPRSGCLAVAGAGGTWNGASLATPHGRSRSFCAYTWSPRRLGGGGPDFAALDAVAMKDKWSRPYVVNDVRTGDAVPPAVTFGTGTPLTFVANTGGGGDRSVGGLVIGGNLTLGGGGSAQGSATPGFTAGPHTDPEGVPGCDVCGEEIGADYLFFVLPPDALDASTVTLETEDAQYDLGTISTPVFYTPIPPTYSGYYYVTWW